MWKKKEGVNVDRTFPPKDTPLKMDDTVEGVYSEKKSNIGDNNSTLYILDSNGEKIGVWSSTVLDTKFSDIEFGTKVKVVYLGMKKSEKGSRQYKDFDVFVWEDEL